MGKSEPESVYSPYWCWTDGGLVVAERIYPWVEEGFLEEFQLREKRK